MIGRSQVLIFADFSGTPTAGIRRLKNELKKVGAQFKVVKKRLLALAFNNAGVDFDPTQFESQVGTIFASGELLSVAGPVYKFSKDLAKTKKNFQILGVYDLAQKAFLNPEQFVTIAKLPPREVLLAQLVGVLSAPIRAFIYVVDELSKRSAPEASAGKVE